MSCSFARVYVLLNSAVVTQLFVSANQGGEDTTKINYIEFVGSTVATTKMSDFKRVCIHTLDRLCLVPVPDAHLCIAGGRQGGRDRSLGELIQVSAIQ